MPRLKSVREHFGYLKRELTQGHKLFPCPECGGRAKLCRKPGFDSFFIRCTDCGHEIDARCDPARAEMDWNKKYLGL